MKVGFLSFSAFPFLSPGPSFLFYFSLFFSHFLYFFPFSVSLPFISHYSDCYAGSSVSPRIAHVSQQKSRNRNVQRRRGQDWYSSFARVISVSVRFREEKVKSKLREERRRDKKVRVNEGGPESTAELWLHSLFFGNHIRHWRCREKTESQLLADHSLVGKLVNSDESKEKQAGGGFPEKMTLELTLIGGNEESTCKGVEMGEKTAYMGATELGPDRRGSSSRGWNWEVGWGQLTKGLQFHRWEFGIYPLEWGLCYVTGLDWYFRKIILGPE